MVLVPRYGDNLAHHLHTCQALTVGDNDVGQDHLGPGGGSRGAWIEGEDTLMGSNTMRVLVRPD